MITSQAHGLRNNEHPTKMKIIYIHDRTLEVRLQSSADDSKWDLCFTLPDVKIPAVAYLGFSAETGELSDNHDIISVNARNIVVPDSNSGGSGPSNQGKSRGQKAGNQHIHEAGWGWTIIKFFVFGFFCVGAYGVYVAYRSQQMHRTRRF
jgi:lectin, mannose-binding 2